MYLYCRLAQHHRLGSSLLRRRPAAVLLLAAAAARALDGVFFASSALCSILTVAAVVAWAIATSLRAAAKAVGGEAEQVHECARVVTRAVL